MRPGRSIRGRFAGVVKRGRLAVAARGCNTHTQRAAAGAAWSRRHSWRHGLFGGSAVTPCRTARRCQGPKRWVETTQPPGAMRRKASNTARGTLERRRTCGTTTNERQSRPRSPFRFGVARHRTRGSVGPPASRAPSDLFRARIGRNDSDATASRERWRLA